MIIKYSKFRFYFLLFLELLFFPILFILEEVKKVYVTKTIFINKMRMPVINKKILVCIHEWGGYKLDRKKNHKNGKSFNCGLSSQIKRFSNSLNDNNLEVTVSMSNSEKSNDVNYLKSITDNFLIVPNTSFDFSGYSEYYDLIKNKENSYVILSNSSVNEIQTEFLDGYIKYMENNPDVAILGTSYSTKCYQSLIRNNFRPHLQSFFLLTTIDVLRSIVNANNNKFPGYGITHKLLLIREGEIKLSEIPLKLGYALAVVLEDGNVLKFKKSNKFDSCFRYWKSIPKGDMRFNVKDANKINPIK